MVHAGMVSTMSASKYTKVSFFPPTVLPHPFSLVRRLLSTLTHPPNIQRPRSSTLCPPSLLSALHPPSVYHPPSALPPPSVHHPITHPPRVDKSTCPPVGSPADPRAWSSCPRFATVDHQPPSTNGLTPLLNEQTKAMRQGSEDGLGARPSSPILVVYSRQPSSALDLARNRPPPPSLNIALSEFVGGVSSSMASADVMFPPVLETSSILPRFPPETIVRPPQPSSVLAHPPSSNPSPSVLIRLSFLVRRRRMQPTSLVGGERQSESGVS
ncbi:hypothetical protein BDN70DRAFT_898553 [Pholiota conissans]|uniref:Uncharacterized protein n=1 Tax=Pholiota conissans TaxID=109636 RepID=A0A9P5YUI0_9AGAR|nr:hypothetical protein BDN70DRAFT_898553 [Pholiota conissans]